MTSPEPAPTTTTVPHVAGPGGERSVWYSGWLLTFLATGEETGQRFSLTEVVGRRGHSAAPPPHVHTREEECFFVVEGAITCHVGGEAIHVPAGAFVVLPRGVPHRYELASEEARLLNLCVPAGFENFYRALSEPAPEPVLPPAPEGPPDVARLLAAAAEHGVEILGPPPAEAGR
ncbi:MAG: quercetin 2,3-dioxygenase [Chloroflexota bacterium]|nr:quercetin 2,3-dioxygenase [Chloroflexota bacterium]